MGLGSSTPLRMIRSRPGRSVTSISPVGRNARLHGLTRPEATTETRTFCTDVSNTCGSGGSGGELRAAAGVTGAVGCWPLSDAAQDQGGDGADAAGCASLLL